MAFNSFTADTLTSEEKAGFNMAIETLKRMNSILIELRFARMEKNYMKWYMECENLYMEIDAFLKDKDRAEVDRLFVKVKPFIRAIQSTGTLLTRPRVEEYLKEAELFLRRKMKDHDLLMPTKGDIGFAMIN